MFVEKQPGLTDAEVREAIETWLHVEDHPQVLNDEVKLELHAVEEDLANLDFEDHDDDVSGEEATTAVGRGESRALHRP